MASALMDMRSRRRVTGVEEITRLIAQQGWCFVVRGMSRTWFQGFVGYKLAFGIRWLEMMRLSAMKLDIWADGVYGLVFGRLCFVNSFFLEMSLLIMSVVV